MNIRLVIVVVALVASALSSASAQWELLTPGSSDAKIARDVSGNIYVAYADATPSNAELWLRKYNVLGELQFARRLRTRAYDRPYTVTGVKVENMRLLSRRTTRHSTRACPRPDTLRP